MGRHTKFSKLMHPLGPNLQLHHGTPRADDGRVKRLIAIVLGNGYVVFEMLRHRRILLGNEAIHGKTVGNALRIDNHP